MPLAYDTRVAYPGLEANCGPIIGVEFFLACECGLCVLVKVCGWFAVGL